MTMEVEIAVMHFEGEKRGHRVKTPGGHLKLKILGTNQPVDTDFNQEKEISDF